MATLLKNIPNNITEYPNSFKRQGAFPLERYSVFPSYQEAKTYAETSKIAYVTQPIGVAYKIGEEIVADYYIIGDENGTLIHIGNSNHNLDEINARIEEIEKFFVLEDGESLKDTLDELIELQKWIEEHLGDFDEFKEQVRVDLETETKNRMEEDKYLSEAISAESARATEAEETLRMATLQNANAINNEQALREEADTGLSVIITTEKSDRQKQYTELQTALNEEVGRAIEEERKISQALNGAVAQLNGTIDTRCALEATERANAIDKLESDITEKLNTEIRNRGESDDLLQNKIEEEVVAREGEVESLRVALAEEANTARNAESNLRQQINSSNAEIYTILAADRERSISVDNELNAALEAETERANQADAELYLALEAETARANAADQELYAAISIETERANKADQELYAALAKEMDRAIAEEQTLAESLNKETSKLDILIGPDGEKSARTIANEELAEQLLSGKADASFKTLQDLAQWIEDHPENVAEINTKIQTNAENIAKETKRATDAESALGGRIDTLTEKTVYLSEDLYAYTNIGLVQASVTNRKLIGAKDQPLKTVFNNIFGVQQDVEPTITNNSALSVSQTTISAGGGEYGTTVSSAEATITFTLNNSGTTNYGYRCGETKTIGSKTFYYAINKFVVDEENGIVADIKIVLPSGITKDDFTFTKGSLVSSADNVLYCNLDEKKVSIKTTLASGSVNTSDQVRLGTISGYVNLGKPQTAENVKIDSFLTFLENDAETAPQNGGEKTKTSTQYKITKGSKYVYWAKTTSEEAPTSWTRYGNGQTSVEDLQLSCAAGEYIWVATTESKTSFYAWNDASGKYNTDKLPTTKSTSTITLTNKQGVSTSGYYTYRTNEMLQAVNTKFKLA